MKAPAKVNLVLRIGPRRGSLHELCSLFASIGLHDSVEVEVAEADAVECPGVEGPNLAAAAIAALRDALGGELPPLRVRIEKRIPVAAGLGGGSADAAAVLRAGNALAGSPLSAGELRAVAAGLGSVVPSQVEPGHAIVSGSGGRVEPVALPAMALVLVPAAEGLSTAAVYAEADRLGTPRAELDCSGLDSWDGALENDLQPAALSLRPELERTIDALLGLGARAAQVSGSGPTVFGVFGSPGDAERAAAALPGALVTMVAGG